MTLLLLTVTLRELSNKHCLYLISIAYCLFFHLFLFQTNLPVFKVKESSVRRRYSDFEWLRNELERDSKVGNVITLTHLCNV